MIITRRAISPYLRREGEIADYGVKVVFVTSVIPVRLEALSAMELIRSAVWWLFA